MKRLGVVAAAMVAGCASQKYDLRFPTRGELAEIAQVPRAEKVLGRKTSAVQARTLSGPFPEVMGERAPESQGPAAAWLLSRAGAKVRPAGELECAAREIATFALTDLDVMPASLERFVLARCGVAASGPRHQLVHVEAPASVDDAAVLGQLGPLLEKALADVPQGSRAGLHLARSAERAVAVLAFVDAADRLEPVAVVPDAQGRVSVRGQASGPVERVSASVTFGPYGVQRCEASPDVSPPQFAFSCPVHPDDERAWISLAVWEPGRVLGHERLRMLAWPKGAPQHGWRQPSFGGEGDDAATAESLLKHVNVVRSHARLGPLVLAPSQSSTATLLASHYFGHAPLQDRIALGLMAGWEVEGQVLEGSFGSLVVRGDSVKDFLADYLEGPAGREALLEKEIGALAAGFHREEGQLAVLVSGYALAGTLKPDDAAREVLSRLNAERAKRQRSPVRRYPLHPTITEPLVQGLMTASTTPGDAIDTLIQNTAEVSRAGVQGWVLTTSSLERLPFPDSLLAHPDPQVGVVVSFTKAKGSAWASWVVLLSVVQGGQMASAPASRGGG